MDKTQFTDLTIHIFETFFQKFRETKMPSTTSALTFVSICWTN